MGSPEETGFFFTPDYEHPDYYICNSCGAIDSIVSNGDAACCRECGSPEDYTLIENGQEND